MVFGNPSDVRLFQHTAARRRLEDGGLHVYEDDGFNTQPPEGGCDTPQILLRHTVCFNTQPPEGGCKIQSKQQE